MKKLFLLFIIVTTFSFAQVENVPVTHPVYNFLLRIENRGILEHFSSSDFPISRGKIKNALKTAIEKENFLNKNEKKTLKLFAKEFGILPVENAVLIYSKSDSEQVFSKRLFSDNEKYIYHFDNNKHNASIIPLANLDNYFEKSDDETENYSIANLGFRLYGTLDNMFGYNLQVTNGRIVNGSRELAYQDEQYAKNVKFTLLDSDIDYTESHLRFQYDWFYANIGRETRLMGSGINQKIFINQHAPAIDAISLGADFKNFKYKFIHGSLIGIADSGKYDWGFQGNIDPKYIAIHKFSVTPTWGEISFWEGIIYSRPLELAYLNPLSFFKSLEHALRDRDNSLMGVDLTIRPFSKFQIKGSYLIDDMSFELIGDGFWGNKTALNIGATYVLPYSIDVGFEYSRVEPFTYSHFNEKNSYTNDKKMIANSLLPNSDRFNVIFNWFWGGRYPVTLDISYTQHGENIYDAEGNLIKNVGSDPMQTITAETPAFIKFLDGNKVYIFDSSLKFGFEFFRGFNMQSIVGFRTINDESIPYFRLMLGIYEL